MAGSGPLTPAESLVLRDLRRSTGRDALKVTLLSLLAQRAIRIVERTERRFLGKRRHVSVTAVGMPEDSAPGHVRSVVELVRAVGPEDGGMARLVAAARGAYGTDLRRFKQDLVLPALAARGLVEKRLEKVLLLFPRERLVPTSSGELARSGIESSIIAARRLPELLKSSPAEAAALALGLGGALLLVAELKPYYAQLGAALRDHGDFGSGADSFSSDSLTFGGETLSFDFGRFDSESFSTLDSSLGAFDSSFDSAAGDSGSSSDGGGSSDSGSSDSGGSDSGGGGDSSC